MVGGRIAPKKNTLEVHKNDIIDVITVKNSTKKRPRRSVRILKAAAFIQRQSRRAGVMRAN